MNIIQRLLILCVLMVTAMHLHSQVEPNNSVMLTEDQKKKINREQIPFSFENKPLLDIIDFLATKKKINIILPQLAADVDDLKKKTVTYQPLDKETMSVERAWNWLHTFLELSGFSLFEKEPGLYAITHTGKAVDDAVGISHQPLPLFISTPPNDLPNSEERIRYVYYLRNLKAPTGKEDRENPITQIFAEMLSPNAITIYEPKSNGIIIVDKANVIASTMNIIAELDATGFRETVEVVPLYNISASEAIKVFDLLKKAADNEANRSPFIRTEQRPEALSYFSTDTKVIKDDRTNSLILMGRESAISRISEFIHENLDVLPESGKSILHVYDLQYLNAQNFAPIIQDIVKPIIASGAQASQGPVGGPERFFQGVIIQAEQIVPVELEKGRITTQEITLDSRSSFTETSGIKGTINTGGNRLVIAALQADWIRVRELIEQLDKPQPQVILEVMIVDFTANRQKALGGTIRNPANLFTNNGNGDGVTFLASHLSNVNNVIGNVAATDLANPAVDGLGFVQDLLQLVSGGANTATPITSLLPVGSTIVSFNDPATPGIFGLIQLLDTQLDTKIIDHPYLITTNNQKATITSQELRRSRGDALPGASGVTTIQIEDVPATIQVQMIPRLSSVERLSLQVAVDVNEFLGATFNRITRRVNTNANLASGQILVIGGLSRVDTNEVVTRTPLLADIPIIGNFFKRITRNIVKTNIAIFISPTIVQPKLRDGLTLYTTDKIRKSRRDIDDYVILGDNRDPITHLFFGNEQTSDHLVRDYLTHASNAPEFEQIKTTKEKRRAARRPGKRPIVPSAPSVPSAPPSTQDSKVTEIIA